MDTSKLPAPLASLLMAAGILVAINSQHGVSDERAQPAQPLKLDPLTVAPPAPTGSWKASAKAEDVGMSPELLRLAEKAVDTQVQLGAFPGAALAIGRADRIVVKEGIGKVGWDETKVNPDATVYDIASLTKVVGTTAAAMLLAEDGRLDLDAPVARYLPTFAGGNKGAVTIRHLLAHNSGLPAGVTITAKTPDAALAQVIATPQKWRAGERVEYSDVGFVVLWAAMERAAGEPLAPMLERRIYEPLGMHATSYGPIDPCDACAPTMIQGGVTIRGRVHDPIANKLGGISGNAGLFSTGHDLGRFAAMLANRGELDGVRIFKESTVRQFGERQAGTGNRGLGWEAPDPKGFGAAGLRISPKAFGHTGFTGTSLWVDPDRRTWVVLLANRTFEPRAPNQIQATRRQVHDRVADATDLASSIRQ
jgi:CubicO group peptidase (beta-lactamase class C family)